MEEVIAAKGMTREEFTRQMGCPAAILSAILKGEKGITPDFALHLENVHGVPKDIWIGMESEYRLILAKQRNRDRKAPS
jgi:HTH-type transcriptional regulator/antitoxin HigA